MLLTTSTERDTHLLVFKPREITITDSLMWLRIAWQCVLYFV